MLVRFRLVSAGLLALSQLPAACWALQCWQCASVDDKRCPEDAKMVESDAHDACITWRLGNGTVLLQNVVVFESECTVDKINFWTKFINLYYRSTGGEVRCCDADGCNTGAFSDGFYPVPGAVSSPSSSSAGAGAGAGALPGAPLIFGAVSNAPPAALPTPQPQPGRMIMPTPQQQHLAALMAGLNGAGLGSLPLAAAGGGSGFPQLSPQSQQQQQQQQQQLLLAMQRQLAQQQQLASLLPLSGFQRQGLLTPAGSAALGGGASSNPNSAVALGANGNCQRYFPKRGNGEWLPTTLMPLSFDRASETKVGVFYVRFTADNGNNDHVIVRLVGQDKSNRTMYSIKLYRVGSVSIFVSRLEANNQGHFEQEEDRKQTVQAAINLTDTTMYRGFWFTVRGEEISLGLIGDQLIDPAIMWNDTRREGPREVAYFALTTDQSQASFGVNCDVPNLHYEDTCVTDDDCKDYPNTVCSNEPVNPGLDPGTRKKPFDEWEDRDSLLKSCFCKEGHVRIPQSQGCYDPIRNVVTLRDACFADYHCQHLPNTQCAEDGRMLPYNHSCQCVPGNKPFDRDPRTGLIEGCAPLTESDRSTILGCGDKIEVDDDFAWVPRRNLFTLKTDTSRDIRYAVFFVKLASSGSRNDIAIVRLLDENRNPRKMYSVKFSRVTGKISICESTRSRSFFFENERDTEKVAINDLDVMTRMQLDYVGFWVIYQYEEDAGGTVSVGLNGSPFSPEYALARWTDRSGNAIERLRYIGFTGSDDSTVSYGVNCVLLDTPLSGEAAAAAAAAGGFGAAQPSSAALGLGNVFGGALAGRVASHSTAAAAAFGAPQFPLPAVGAQNGAFSSYQGLQSQVASSIHQLQAQQQRQRQYLQALQRQQQQQQQQQQSDAAAGNPWAALMQNQLLGISAASSASSAQAPQQQSLLGRHSASEINLEEVVPVGRVVLEGGGGGGEEVTAAGSGGGMEPELRNQYLSKLKRLLPSFFEEEEGVEAGEGDGVDLDQVQYEVGDEVIVDGGDYGTMVIE